MTLIELLEVISDSTTVEITENNEQIAYYDGKESIDESLNNATVLRIEAQTNEISIEISR